MRRIYIAGPMTGILRYNFPAFDAAAEMLRLDGWDVVNPAELNREMGFDGLSDKIVASTGFLRNDLTQLLTCDSIALLPGFRDSEGAMLEAYVAARVGMRFYGIDPRGLTYNIRTYYPMEAPSFGALVFVDKFWALPNNDIIYK